MKNCHKCNAGNPDNAKFCNQCGSRLIENVRYTMSQRHPIQDGQKISKELREEILQIYTEHRDALKSLERKGYPLVSQFIRIAERYEEEKGRKD